MRHEQLTIEVLPREGSVTVRLVGEIDMATAPKIRDAALCAMRQHAPTIHLDLSGVTFMDSTGLEVLLATRRHAELEGGQLHLVDPTRSVLRVLEITGVDRLFHISQAQPASAPGPVLAIPPQGAIATA